MGVKRKGLDLLENADDDFFAHQMLAGPDECENDELNKCWELYQEKFGELDDEDAISEEDTFEDIWASASEKFKSKLRSMLELRVIMKLKLKKFCSLTREKLDRLN